MAKGWESKSVESQQDSAETKKEGSGFGPHTTEEVQRQWEKDVLELSRKKVVKDLESATNPRYRETLEAALKHLDKEIAKLG